MREESLPSISTREPSSLGAGLRSAWRTAVAAAFVVTAIGAGATPAPAEDATIRPTTTLEVAPAQVVTRGALKRMTRESAGRAPIDTPQAPFRPTMSQAAYEAAKSAAASLSPENAKPAQGDGSQGNAPGQLAAPSVQGIQFTGVDQATAGGWRPPDTHGAVGKYHYCQVVNSYIQCYQKGGTSAVVLSTSLNSFFGYGAQDLFDPRVVYDATWDRWVVYVEAFPESSTVQRLFIGVSKGASPTSGWWTYNFNITFTPDDFWDYGSIGMDQDAVILAANNFNGASYVDSRLFTIAKAQLYNGRGFGVPVFTGLAGTLQPPIVLDQDAQAYVVAAEDNITGTIRKYTLEKTANALETTIAESTITVPAWGIPPDASQPGTTDVVDTLDSRFQSASTQNGGMLWQTHTTGSGPYPIPKWYKFDVEADSLAASGSYYVYSGSHDFNPSIAANAAGDFYVTWAMTCPTAGSGCPNGTKNVQLRFSGKRVADPALFGNNPTGAYGLSASAYSEFRFGDYSAVSIDPVTPSRAWITNEFFTGPTSWASRIARIGY